MTMVHVLPTMQEALGPSDRQAERLQRMQASLQSQMQHQGQQGPGQH